VNNLVTNTSKFSPKRNKFQIANDRKLAIELLSAGKTYTYIAQHLSTIRDYSLSSEQIRQDVGAIQENLIASALQHGLEAIAAELDKIENIMIDVSRRLQAFPDGDKGAAPLLKLMADLSARQTYLKGGDTWIKAQDLNSAIERVIRAGFKIVDPIDALNRDEPIDIPSEVVQNAD
jgi:septation ring formation regulator EzrA